MSKEPAVFHLAIPTHDLDAAEDFYTRVIGAVRARRYDDRVTFRFFDHQVVCHLDPDSVDMNQGDPFANLYPRHFGITFRDKSEFDALYERCQSSGWSLVKEVFERFGGYPERHQTFFVADPSHNLIEFKWYEDSRFVY